MKLEQIFEVIPTTTQSVPTRTHQTTRSRIDAKRQDPNRTSLGRGAHAYVDTHDDANFGDVERLADDDDITSVYLDLVRTKLPNNPFAPKVKSMNTEGGSSTASMERLYPFSEYKENYDMLKSVYKRYFTTNPNDDSLITPAKLLARLKHEVENNAKGVKDSDLKELINTLTLWKQQLIRERKYQKIITDLHPGNVMWRPSQYGPQLVITDPFNGLRFLK